MKKYTLIILLPILFFISGCSKLDKELKLGAVNNATSSEEQIDVKQDAAELCPKSISDFNKEFSTNEKSDNSYSVINANNITCFYNKDGLAALPYTLQYYERNNFFNSGNGGKYSNDEFFEWFRYENDNKLYIYLSIAIVPGQDYLDKRVLVVDLNNNNITGETKNSPYIDLLVLSPDKKRAIEWDDNKLYLYDFVFNKRLGLIIDLNLYMKTDYNGVSLRSESGELLDGTISWVNNQKIQIQLFVYKEGGIEKFGNLIIKDLTNFPF